MSDVKTLALEVPKLDGQLARALAQAELADAAWTLDRTWAKNGFARGISLNLSDSCRERRPDHQPQLDALVMK